MLHQSGMPYVLAEAETVCGGITKNTTAKITSQHGLIYDKLIREFDVEKAKQYLEANEAALGKYRDLCRNIDCDFEEKASYVYSLDDRKKIEKEILALEKEHKETLRKIARYEKILGSRATMNQVIKDDLEAIKAELEK